MTRPVQNPRRRLEAMWQERFALMYEVWYRSGGRTLRITITRDVDAKFGGAKVEQKCGFNAEGKPLFKTLSEAKSESLACYTEQPEVGFWKTGPWPRHMPLLRKDATRLVRETFQSF